MSTAASPPSLCSNSVRLEGFLRNSIEICESKDCFSLRHPCWDLELSSAWVNARPELAAFFRRSIPIKQINLLDTQSEAILRLLSEQGCLTFVEDVPEYSFRDARALFIAVRNEWFGEYYKHPIWLQLRTGKISLNGLVQWLIYTYHLSRSAGISAARMAISGADKTVRTLFFKNTLEEYSHFFDYFLVQHPTLRLTGRDIQSSIPLRSATAFHQQMMSMAESNWLGHVFVAMFQESTVQFHESCNQFYEEVEAKYNVPDLLTPWREHIRVDIDCLHADRLDQIFDSDEVVPIEDLKQGLRGAWLAFRFLISALDEIIAESSACSDPLLRMMPSEHTSRQNGLLRGYEFKSRFLSSQRTAAELCSWMLDQRLVAPERSPSWLLHEDLTHFRLSLVQVLYRALGQATTDAEILTLGGLLATIWKSLSDLERAAIGKTVQPVTEGGVAVANFLKELASRPPDVCFAVHSILSAASLYPTGTDSWLPDGLEVAKTLKDFLGNWELEDKDRKRLFVQQLQLNELIRYPAMRNGRNLEMNFFRGFR